MFLLMNMHRHECFFRKKEYSLKINNKVASGKRSQLFFYEDTGNISHMEINKTNHLSVITW